MKYIVDIKGDIEGDYDIVGKYEERCAVNRMDDLISRQEAIDAIVRCTNCGTEEELRGYVVKHYLDNGWTGGVLDALDAVEGLPSTQPDRLTDDDFETIRIHLNSYKEKLCNQKRWKEAEEYQRIIDRFMAFASAQPETAKRIVGKSRGGMTLWYQCDMCNEPVDVQDNYCRGCGRRLIDE